MSEFLRQIEYKMKWSGGTVVKVDRWYPSSKTCSACGFVLDTLSLGTREWICPQCGAQHNRDVNAACNLRNMAVSSTVENACGGLGRTAPPVKQEPTTTEVLWEQVDQCWRTNQQSFPSGLTSALQHFAEQSKSVPRNLGIAHLSQLLSPALIALSAMT